MDSNKNVKLNPVVFRYQQWKQDKWSLLRAAQDERQRLMLEIAQRQKTVKELTAIIEEHQPTQQSWKTRYFSMLS